MLQFAPPVDADATPPAPPPNPWRTIWFSPRRTIRRIVDADVRPSWWPVIALALVGQAFAALEFDASGGVALDRSAMPMAIGVLQTIFGVLVGPFLLAFVGGWLGGEADPSEIRQSVAWGYVPLAVTGVCWIPVAFSVGGNGAEGNAEVPTVLVPLMVAIMVGVAWSVVLQVITLAEVQRFSILRAIASILSLLIPVASLGIL